MVIHTVINEYDLLYAQNREMSFVLSPDKGAEAGEVYEPFSDLSTAATVLTLKDKGDIIL